LREDEAVRRTLLVLALFSILTVILTWPLALEADHAVEDYQDALLNTWITAWDVHALLTDPLHFYDANIFYPYPRTLALSEIILPHALMAMPAILASNNPVLGYNLGLLMSFVLSGLGGFLLTRRMTRSTMAGVAAGVVFAFNAYKLSNIAQVQLLSLQWLPFVLLALGHTLSRRRRRDGVCLSIFFVLQALSSFYYAIFMAVAVVLFLVVWLVIGHRSMRALGHTVLWLIVASAVVLPFVLPYMAVQQEQGFSRPIQESEPFSASLIQYIQALPGNLVYGRLLAPQQPVVIGGYPLDALFPGLLTVAMAGGGVAAWRREWRRWLFPLLLLLVSVILSLGPVLYLRPGERAPWQPPLPYSLLYDFIPGMQGLRAPVRFVGLAYLGLAILSGFGVVALERGKWRGIGVMALVGMTVEVSTFPAVAITPIATGERLPVLYGWLERQRPGPMLELPMMATAGQGLLAQYFSIYHWRPTPDGYSGFIPPKHGEIVYEMEDFPSPRSVALLQGLGIRYVVVHPRLFPDWPQRAALLPAYQQNLELVAAWGSDALVLAVQPATPHADLEAAWYLPSATPPLAPISSERKRASGAAQYTASLIVWVKDGILVVPPTERVMVQATWQSDGRIWTMETSASMPLVTRYAAVIPFSIPLPVHSGLLTLSLVGRSPLLGTVEGTTTVQVTPTIPRPPQPIPARLLEARPERRVYRAGETVHIAIRWLALGKIDAYYSLSVRLMRPDGTPLVAQDGYPGRGQMPTLLWHPDTQIDDPWDLPIPADAPPGTYPLEIVIYDHRDLSGRLSLDDQGRPIPRLLLPGVTILP